jgi:predicted molibdopterin-dependent oxidoreductase YjgC
MHTEPGARAHPLFTSASSPEARSVTLHFEGNQISAPEGLSVAAALLLAGVSSFRTSPVSGACRAPFCMMGVCFECLIEVNGRPSRQACLTTVEDGMVIRRQLGASSIAQSDQESRNGS